METSASIELAKHVLSTFALILGAGTVFGFISQKLKVPDVAVFLLVGIALGPEAGNLINIRVDSALNQIILIFGASYILFDGGATLRLKVLKQVWLTIVLLATLGVLVTAGITAVAAYYVFSLPLIVALLLGLTFASTDPATLVPVFKQVKIKDRVAQTVLSESAFNDATGAIATFAVLGIALGHAEFSVGGALADLAQQAGLGLLAGAILGYLAALLIAHEKFGFFREYAPLVTLMAVLGAYLSADGVHASGFMAVFVFGIVLGNKEVFGFRMRHGDEGKMEDFVATTAFIMRMFVFILLGAQVDFSLMNKYLAGGIAVVTVFMLVARPVAVFVCALPDRRAKWEMKELLFMCWTRETGVIPGALAGLLLGMGAPEAGLIASVTFIAIMMTILIQATTTKWLAGKLGLLSGD
ncbi:MAG TPA: cation:proton antiporter [Gallionellaceae bacterium]